MSMESTCIQEKMEVELEMFHCDRAHLFAVRSSAITSQYIMRFYLKAWRAKQKVFEMRFDRCEASYDNLRRMLSQVAARNPGSFYDTYLVPTVTTSQSILQRVFFCLGACVRAFQYCLPVICIDGTFLTGRYKCQILTAIGVDCNNQIIPLAFAFVENENLDSWYWFLERVKVHVVAAVGIGSLNE